MDTAPISYRCAKTSHQHPRPGADHHLTVHERKWAFCAYDSKVNGHEWEPTGEISLSTLTIRPMAMPGPLRPRAA